MDPITIVMPALFTLIGFVVWVAVTGWQRRQHVRLVTDFNMRLLDRLGTLKDFSDFLETAAGAALMKSLSSEMPASKPHDRVIRAMQIGVVLMSLGIGLFSVGEFIAFDDLEQQRFFTVLGMLVLSLGIGFLVSAGVAYKVGTSLGVFNRTDHS